MPPKMNIWTNEAEQLLIDLVEERPILWDIRQDNYRRNDLKEIEWEKVSLKMGASYTVEHVKKRWNNMRGTFLDNDRRVRDSKRSGSSSADIFNPRWPFYSRLQFLKKTISSAQSLSNFSYEPIAQHLLPLSQFENEDLQNPSDNVHILSEETSCDAENSMFYFDRSLKTITLLPKDMCAKSLQNASETSEETIASDTSLMSIPSTISPRVSQLSATATSESLTSVMNKKKDIEDNTLYTKRKTSKKQKSTSAMEEAVEVIKQIASQPIVLPEHPDGPVQDAIDHFTAYIGAKLREMSPQRRTLSEKEIMKIIFAS